MTDDTCFNWTIRVLAVLGLHAKIKEIRPSSSSIINIIIINNNKNVRVQKL